MPGTDDLAFPTLTSEQLDRLTAAGTARAVAAGELLFAEGQELRDLHLVLEGTVRILRRAESGDEVIAEHGPGRFLGELNLLTGQRTLLAARMTEPGRVVAVPVEALRRLMASDAELGDRIFAALVARREALQRGAGARTLQIIGSRYSAEAMRLRAFARSSALPHTWIELEGAEDVEVLLASRGLRPADTPVVVTPHAVLRNPTPGALSHLLGLAVRPEDGTVHDLVVVGAGPGGLAAGVYGASEGLDTVVLDSVGVGGQAGASSRIENYLGFPTGISGDELTQRAAMQAQRLGAVLRSPCNVRSMRAAGADWVLDLDDGAEIRSRSVILALGARYRRLDVDELGRFEGAGVYYAATDLEARSVAPAPAVVVGGGNSAGQAAVHLAGLGCPVTVVVRGDGLAASMSTYLIDRIEAHPHIELRTRTEVRALAGSASLESVELEHTPSGRRDLVPCRGLFSFIGASAPTDWLRDLLALDPSGFVLTDRLLRPEDLGPAWRDGDLTPLPFETSCPGVFAVGDTRAGSMKRVAAAVGEGSSAVRSVHARLGAG